MRIYEVIGRTPAYRLRRHDARLDRPAWRQQQQQRYEREVSDTRTRHMPKSGVGYRPQQMPLIRFGKFGKRSQIGLDDEFRAEMGNPTHEAGVSVYRAMPNQMGWEVIEPDKSRAVYNVNDPFAPLDKFSHQLLDYLDHDTPMDIFLIHGYLTSFGPQAHEYLELGSDGEYLLDTSKPYRMERLTPQHTYIGPLNFIQWVNARNARAFGAPKGPGAGIAYLRQEREYERAELE